MLIVQGDFINNRGRKVSVIERQDYITFFSDGTSMISKAVKELEDKYKTSRMFRIISLIKYKVLVA